MSSLIFLDDTITPELLQRLVCLQAGFYPAWSASQIEAQLASKRSLNIALSIDDNMTESLIGFVFYQVLFEQAEILQVCIAPSYQQRGFATKLLSESFTHLRQQQIETVLLEVRPSNTGAIKLYQQLGFSLDGKRKGYYLNANGQREDASLYSKHLIRL